MAGKYSENTNPAFPAMGIRICWSDKQKIFSGMKNYT
jgi:hypothetical protein